MIAGQNVRKPQDHVISVETDCAVKKAIRTDLELTAPDAKNRNYQIQIFTIVFKILIVNVYDIITFLWFYIIAQKSSAEGGYNVSQFFRLYWRRNLFNWIL